MTPNKPVLKTDAPTGRGAQRVAVFGDIHGNLPALRAALDDMRAQGAGAYLCLGDVAMDGPWPAECVQLVHGLGCPVVRGNADRQVLAAPFAFTPRGFPDEQKIYDIGQWSAAQLGEAERRMMQSYQKTVTWPDLLCFHGSPERDDEVLDAGTPAEQLEALAQHFPGAAYWAGGHTHQPLLRSLNGWTLLNPGSVGLPFEKRGEDYVNLARAEYLLLDKVRGGWQASFRRVPYDVQNIRKGFLERAMPHAQWAADSWVACGSAAPLTFD